MSDYSIAIFATREEAERIARADASLPDTGEGFRVSHRVVRHYDRRTGREYFTIQLDVWDGAEMLSVPMHVEQAHIAACEVLGRPPELVTSSR